MQIQKLNYKDEPVQTVNPEDYGLKLSEYLIQPPSIREMFVPVPYRNGSIDLTEILGNGKIYGDRNGTFEFAKIIKSDDDLKKALDFATLLNGSRAKINIDSETVTGRLKVTLDKNKKLLTVKVSGVFNIWE
jgi:hypothetical protein